MRRHPDPATEILAGMLARRWRANPAQNIRVFETPPNLVDGATVSFVGGVGSWTFTG